VELNHGKSQGALPVRIFDLPEGSARKDSASLQNSCDLISAGRSISRHITGQGFNYDFVPLAEVPRHYSFGFHLVFVVFGVGVGWFRNQLKKAIDSESKEKKRNACKHDFPARIGELASNAANVEAEP
jgi:hypothetical protein